MTTAHLLDDLKRDEGCKTEAYKDTLGIWTVGVGHAHVAPGTVWSMAQCMATLQRDVDKAMHDLDTHLPWWRQLNDVRQDVLVNMTFNMGMAGVLGFKNTLAYMHAGEWAKAADGMLASKWARQVGARAGRLSEKMRHGV